LVAFTPCGTRLENHRQCVRDEQARQSTGLCRHATLDSEDSVRLDGVLLYAVAVDDILAELHDYLGLTLPLVEVLKNVGIELAHAASNVEVAADNVHIRGPVDRRRGDWILEGNRGPSPPMIAHGPHHTPIPAREFRARELQLESP
jgi:hypothetical protein